MQTIKRTSSFPPTLMLSEHFLPVRGGTITWLLQTYSRYAWNEVTFIVGDHSDARSVDPSLPFRVERIPMKMADWDPTQLRSLWRYCDMLRRVQRSCRRNRSQQIHCMKALPEGLVAWGVRWLTSVPYLLYAHGEEILTGLTSRKLSWILPRIYNGAAAIIANSYHTKGLLEGIGVRPEVINVIHPGVDAAAFQANEKAKQSIRQRHNLEGNPTLLTIGRLQRRKGQDMVIQALPFIIKKFPTVKYLIVGTGEELGSLQQLVRDSGVWNHVVFVGQVPDEERAAYYAACDVFLMPNREICGDIEGFGMVFLEAGAAGKPVIGGKSGGTGEAILEGVTGLRVDGTCQEEIAAAVIRLLSDPIKAVNMGAQGRQRVETEFTWQSVVQRTRELSEKINKHL